MENIEFKLFRNCEKDSTYEEKVTKFKENLHFLMLNFNHVSIISQLNFDDVIGLLNNKNVMVPTVPIFQYNDKVMSFGCGKNDSYDNGKYEILTVDEIKKRTETGYLVFIYNLFDCEYEDGDDLKFRTVILNEK